MKDCDFLVVGGGPAGTSFAAATAPKASVVVVEEHPEVGLPVQCTGLVAPRVVEMASAFDTVLNRLHGAYFHFPGDQVVEVRSREVKAMVVNRASFDRSRAERALDQGAVIERGTRFVSADFGKWATVRCKAGGQTVEYRARMVVGADGYKSNVASCAGLGPPRDRVRGLQVDLRHRMEDQDMLSVFLGRKVAPG
ncbi:MAG: FAD-dependent monooxygenase, partial [Methanomassiliicoccales archaeon]|nr:FAD-dependent monooxygenase [Methanomassiliicoccales archaeon]